MQTLRTLESLTEDELLEIAVDVFLCTIHSAWMDTEGIKKFLCDNIEVCVGAGTDEYETPHPLEGFTLTPQTFFNLTNWLLKNNFDIGINATAEAASTAQDRNFEVRLKARIDKKLDDAGFFNALLDASNSYEDYSERKQKFFDSLDDITLEQLQGKNPNPLPVEAPHKEHDREVASKAWDAAFDYGVHQTNIIGQIIEGQIYPDKETYLSTHFKH